MRAGFTACVKNYLLKRGRTDLFVYIYQNESPRVSRQTEHKIKHFFDPLRKSTISHANNVSHEFTSLDSGIIADYAANLNRRRVLGLFLRYACDFARSQYKSTEIAQILKASAASTRDHHTATKNPAGRNKNNKHREKGI